MRAQLTGSIIPAAAGQSASAVESMRSSLTQAQTHQQQASHRYAVGRRQGKLQRPQALPLESDLAQKSKRECLCVQTDGWCEPHLPLRSVSPLNEVNLTADIDATWQQAPIFCTVCFILALCTLFDGLRLQGHQALQTHAPTSKYMHSDADPNKHIARSRKDRQTKRGHAQMR